MMLTNLVFVTRPASEVQDHNEAVQWVGMPEYVPQEQPIKIVVSFASAEDRAGFADRLGLVLTEKTKAVWYPERSRDDRVSLRFDADSSEEEDL